MFPARYVSKRPLCFQKFSKNFSGLCARYVSKCPFCFKKFQNFPKISKITSYFWAYFNLPCLFCWFFYFRFTPKLSYKSFVSTYYILGRVSRSFSANQRRVCQKIVFSPSSKNPPQPSATKFLITICFFSAKNYVGNFFSTVHGCTFSRKKYFDTPYPMGR